MAMADQTDDKSGKQPQAPRERGGWLAKIAPGVRNLVAKREKEILAGSFTVKVDDNQPKGSAK